MELWINYLQAQSLVDKYITEPYTRLHLRESEVIMRWLARHFWENEEQWWIIGFLHDLDWDITKGSDQTNHCVLVQSLLRDAGGTDFLIDTIASHWYDNESIPELRDKKRTTRIEYSLAAAETLTWLIFATALMQPEKKLENVKFESLKSKFKNKWFASRCDRNIILECEKAGIGIDEFLQIWLSSMKEIAWELWL
ncbi:MAG: metal dependent phosphohydrolase [uncultured bacterium (gcode 4)]|uniref:Metal dependent phosphohydrolase n=1 Tax=uncultured bacterium (gcode 4) TaxID=1234023 RepID=K2H0I8_9BACT|nr:MAG: metal dependent phosphohydrolase [uncultured bacterium (gcode 4)]